ncbi:hypothetical protein [Mycobacterium sp. NPDC004974]
MSHHDRNGHPITETEKLTLYADLAYRQVAALVSRNGRVELITWWLGGAPSLLFSTTVIGGPNVGAIVFYRNELDARFGHQRAVGDLLARRHVWFRRSPFRKPGPMVLMPSAVNLAADRCRRHSYPFRGTACCRCGRA